MRLVDYLHNDFVHMDVIEESTRDYNVEMLIKAKKENDLCRAKIAHVLKGKIPLKKKVIH